MSKQTEAMKLALEAMIYADACLKKQLTTKDKHQYAQDLLLEAGTAIREALAEQFCDNHCTWLDHHPECDKAMLKEKNK